MKKFLIIIPIVFVIGVGAWAGIFYWRNLSGVGPTVKPPVGDVVELIEGGTRPPLTPPYQGEEAPTPSQSPPQAGGEVNPLFTKEGQGEVPVVNNTDFPLTLPDGFEISIFAKDLDKPRVMAMDPFGNMWVTEMGAGAVTWLRTEDGKVVEKNRVIKELNRPHGLVFDPQNEYRLYYADEGGVYHFPTYSDAGGPVKVADLPSGGNHFSRTIKFGPDDRLYISIGSTCNVCHEDDPRRAAIYSMNRDGSDFKLFAKGLRNTVDFTWSYIDGRMWGVDNGRDLIGDDIPPDEINIIEEGGNYGWPTCYGKNIHDTFFDKNTYIRNPCQEPFERGSYIDLQAHVAPLGLEFIPEEGWPEEYWYDLLVAEHGSWNRTDPVGYKIERVKLDEFGNFKGTEDFISGWLTDEGAFGRPVDLLVLPRGIMYISDDKAGVIYKVIYNE